ncbi:RNA polymerase II transcription factor B subunit 4 [Agyrium rufum]|nr:RNA polymerase II transcription factor B subunit 4 [Agyrium rufum]
MNAVDGSDHYERTSNEPPPSLLAVIIDTNPHAWALLHDILPLSKAVANLLVFINAHLAFNYANEVAIIASHTQRAEFLYPPPTRPAADRRGEKRRKKTRTQRKDKQRDGDGDVEMVDGEGSAQKEQGGQDPRGSGTTQNNDNGNDDDNDDNESSDDNESEDTATPPIRDDANHYRPFHELSVSLHASLSSLYTHTSTDSISQTPTTNVAGALTLALSYISKRTQSSNPQPSTTTSTSNPNTLPGQSNNADSSSTNSNRTGGNGNNSPPLISRILILSVSGDLSTQYIPLMNCIFASQRMATPIDILKIAGDTVFLQQASDATHGIYLNLGATSLSSSAPLVAAASTTKTKNANGSANGGGKGEGGESRGSGGGGGNQQGILQYLLMTFLPDQTARKNLWAPASLSSSLNLPPSSLDPSTDSTLKNSSTTPVAGGGVDFRAACFCHRRVVDIGYVCSVCLSIFCEEGINDGIGGVMMGKGAARCATCGTVLRRNGKEGVRIRVLGKKKKKRRRVEGDSTGGGGGSGVVSGRGTPAA